ncbi:MAG TPA: hypothetical protein VER58_17725 [Thermoanaerobaculia bacterium]|nr:hypothetical protein [Thermoanaerobaculia bacterium]
MALALESAKAKLTRAEETAGTLVAEVDAFVRANPNPYRVTGELRNGNREYVFTAFGELDIPIRFSVLVGEVMYQLRTALDHVLAALVVANGNVPSDRHQFPICSAPEKFAEASKRGDIAGVSTTASKLIELFQPYQADHPAPRLLDLLREWNNADKHRLLVVVGGAAAIGNELRIQEVDSNFSIAGLSPPHIKRVTNSGADIFTIFLGEPHSKFVATAKFQTHVAVENVGHVECAGVDEVVTKMIGFVRHILSTFENQAT